MREVTSGLRRAVATIQVHGWCQGYPRGPEGEYCLIAAVVHGIDWRPGDAAYEKTYQTCKRLLMRVIETEEGSATPLQMWNDKKGRTIQEVITLLQNATYLAEERGI